MKALTFLKTEGVRLDFKDNTLELDLWNLFELHFMQSEDLT